MGRRWANSRALLVSNGNVTTIVQQLIEQELVTSNPDPAVQVSPSNGPSDWQESYEQLSRKSRRIAGQLAAAE